MDSRRSTQVDSTQTGVQPRLWRSTSNQVVAGVIGGLAERLDVSATGLRWFTVCGTFFSGVFPGVVVYSILWAITEKRRSPPAADGY